MTAKRAERVLVAAETRSSREPDRPAAQRIIQVVGWAFLLVGAVDLALLWVPARLGSVAWEFATVGRTLDAFPMPALGFALIAFAAASAPRGRPARLRGIAVGFAVLAIGLLLLAALLATSAPAVLSQTPEAAQVAVRRAILRHGAQAVAYPTAFAVLAIYLWRKTT